MTTPPYECPTRTVGPSCAAIARLAAATSSAKDVRGLPAVVTRRPLAFSNGTTFDQLESSANAPCTSTTFFAAPAPPLCAIAAPPNEYDPAAYTTAVTAKSVRIGPPVAISSQVSRTPLERFACFCRSGFARWSSWLGPATLCVESWQPRGDDTDAECAAEAVFLVSPNTQARPLRNI